MIGPLNKGLTKLPTIYPKWKSIMIHPEVLVSFVSTSHFHSTVILKLRLGYPTTVILDFTVTHFQHQNWSLSPITYLPEVVSGPKYSVARDMMFRGGFLRWLQIVRISRTSHWKSMTWQNLLLTHLHPKLLEEEEENFVSDATRHSISA